MGGSVMRTFFALLCMVCLPALAGAAGTDTPTVTQSPTVTPTPTATPTPTFTYAGLLPTPSVTATATWGPVLSKSPSATQSPFNVATATPTPTNSGPSPTWCSTIIASFDGTDTTSPLIDEDRSGELTFSVVSGSYSTGQAMRCQGNLADGGFAALDLSYTAAPMNLACTGYFTPCTGLYIDGIYFGVNAAVLPGLQLKVTVHTAGDGDLSALVTVPGLGVWSDLEVASPDVNAAGRPVLAPDPLAPASKPWSVISTEILSVEIGPAQAGAFDFTVQPVLWTLKPCGSPTATPPLSPTASPTFTRSPTPTASPTTLAIAAAPLSTTAIASFEGGDLVTPLGLDFGGGTTVLNVTPGCPYGSAGAACHCVGSCVGASSCGLDLSFSAGATSCATVESSTRTLTFHLLAAALPGQQLRVVVATAFGAYSAMLTAPASGVWTDVTVAMPDDQTPGNLPQLAADPTDPPTAPWAQAIGAVTGIGIQPVGPGAFDFTVDDLCWGSAGSGASPSQVAAALGASLSDVEEAYSYGLDDLSTWILIILSHQCGCHPHTVMALRATLSWGQIAAQYNTTWEAVTDAALAAGLDPDPGQPEQLLRTLRNGPPDVTPLPSATPYVPIGPLVLPPAGGC